MDKDISFQCRGYMMENPYHPIDPMWFVVENLIARQKYKEQNEKISQIFEKMRRENIAFILTTPKSARVILK